MISDREFFYRKEITPSTTTIISLFLTMPKGAIEQPGGSYVLSKHLAEVNDMYTCVSSYQAQLIPWTAEKFLRN